MDEHNTRWHHGLVATMALIYFGIACLQFLVLWGGLGGILRGVNPEFLTLVRSMPGWLNLVWALGVFGGLLGAWLLHTRNKLSPAFLFLAFACLCLLGVWISFFTRPALLGIYGFSGLYVMTGTLAIAALFWLYARWERAENMLEL